MLYMLHNTNTIAGLPYGMSNVTDPAHISAAQFLSTLWPGIRKLRIRSAGHTRRSVVIKVITGTEIRRVKYGTGCSLGSAVANLIQTVRRDADMRSRLEHPKWFS